MAKAKAKPKVPAAPAIDRTELAANYGWSLAVLNSNPELNKAFNLAVKNGWTPERFVAEIRTTKWFKTATEKQRQNAILRVTDPTEFHRRRAAVMGTVRTDMGALGANLSEASIAKLTDQAFGFGWSDDELRRNIANANDWTKSLTGKTAMGGQAGQIEADIRKTAGAYGVPLGDKFVAGKIDKILQQQETPDNYLEYFKNVAKNTYGAYAKQIDEGHTVEELAEPFKQSMGKLLEVDSNALDLNDPTLRKAMMNASEDGKPSALPVWQFEAGLRKDPRWLKTDNAKQAYGALTHNLLSQWGMVS